MVKFNIITTDKEVFIQLDTSGYRSNHDTHRFLFDGVKSFDTFHKDWARINKVPGSVKQFEGKTGANYRFDLKNPALESHKIPKSIPQAEINIDEDGEWKEPYSGLESLYEFKYDEVAETYKDVEFSLNIVMNIDKIEDYSGFSYDVNKSKWEHEGTIKLTDTSIRHPMVDEILFPNIILPSRPSSLSSLDSYRIIRQHVKTNINPKYACISSDYDFCFRVEKVIELNKPESYKCDISSIRSKKPKYETRYRNDRKVTIFEMTYSPENYKGYTPIPGFTGKNHKDLKQNIDKFLKELMKKINEPLKDCLHCNGMGVIVSP